MRYHDYQEWEHNPIPGHKRNQLLKWLAKEVIRYEREEDFDYFAGLFDDIAEVDPSKTGKFSQWILKQLVSNRLQAPDDFEKVNQALTLFLKIARRLPAENRNILAYQNYSELFRTIEEFLPKTRSKKELRNMGTKLVYRDDTYSVYELSTPEAAMAASKNTGWCTCGEKMAKQYLKDANLYIFYKGEERFLLAHPGTHEVMTVDNDPYEANDPHVMSIFAKYLPDMLCDECKNSLKNKECYSCLSRGCSCYFIKCSEGTCDEWMCGGSECGAQCKNCEVWFCHDHVVDECDGCDSSGPRHLCRDCFESCDSCNRIMCVDHQGHCNVCEGQSCDDCMEECYSCNLSHCSDCTFNCGSCGEESCKDCVSKSMKLSSIQTTECNDCGGTYCPDCLSLCLGCKNATCETCFGENPRGGPDICSDCVYTVEMEIEEEEED
jgi:hypothetical protein